MALKLLSFSLRTNIACHQFETANRLMTFYENSLKQYITYSSRSIEKLQASIEKIEINEEIDYGFLMMEANEDEKTPFKCP